MKDTFKTSLRRGHNEGNIRQRADGRWEVRLSAGIDYKTGKPRRTSTCCNTRQEAIAIMYTNQICIAPPKNSVARLFLLCSTVHNMFLLAKG